MGNVFHKLKVIEKSFLTNDAVLLTFQVTDDLKDSFIFSSGQYITLKSEINNVEFRRSYSICTSPEENRLSVVVKAIKDGTFSNFIKNNIEADHYLEVSLPEGRFVYNASEDSGKNIFLVAAGSGITPIISIAKNILFNGPSNTVTLLFANRDIDNTIFFNELESLRFQFEERLKIIYIFSQKNYENYHFGRIDHEFLENVIRKEFNFQNISEFYSCGPEELVKNLHNYLESIGIPKEKMKSELFYSLENEKEAIFENTSEGEIKVEVIIDQESYHVMIDSSKSILESLLDQGLDIPYSCKKGNCSSCVGKVISGSVHMKATDILMDYEIEDGYILSCKSVPVSQELIISYDEY